MVNRPKAIPTLNCKWLWECSTYEYYRYCSDSTRI